MVPDALSRASVNDTQLFGEIAKGAEDPLLSLAQSEHDVGNSPPARPVEYMHFVGTKVPLAPQNGGLPSFPTTLIL